MKKKILIVMTAFVLGLIILAIGCIGDEPLDPGVKQALTLSFPEVAPEDNAYVGLSGLGGIQDGDVVAAGKKYLRDGPQFQPDSEAGQRFDFSYRNPCLDENADGCLELIAADASIIDAAVEKNKILLERYFIVRAMPAFVNISAFSDPVPRYQHLIEVSRLLAAKALLDIKRHGLEAGLESIETDLAFYKRICHSEYIGLIDLMISIAALTNDLNSLAWVIEDGQTDISGNEDRFRKMLDLDLNAAQMMAKALESEKRQILQSLEHLSNDLSGEGFGFQNSLAARLSLFFFKKNMTLNRVAARADEDIEQVRAMAVLGYPDYVARQLVQDETDYSFESKQGFRALYDEYGIFFYKNFYGEMLVNIARPMYNRYSMRINDLDVYAHLLRAQLELRLMEDRPEDISEALSRLGPETWNPYTGRPFAWNKEKNTIWSVSAAKLGRAPGDGESSNAIMEVKVPDLPGRKQTP